MNTDEAGNARKQMKLTATEQAVLLDIAEDPEFAHDMVDDDDHDVDANNDTLVTLHVPGKPMERTHPSVNVQIFLFLTAMKLIVNQTRRIHFMILE